MGHEWQDMGFFAKDALDPKAQKRRQWRCTKCDCTLGSEGAPSPDELFHIRADKADYGCDELVARRVMNS